ncbi:MAG: hypothetical protein OFPI_36890 [Osedax symbiont Rs2]|nr:MAG: hypothetical protein OFPI_36890 [Osedax symbiont Rs2]
MVFFSLISARCILIVQYQPIFYLSSSLFSCRGLQGIAMLLNHFL